MSHKSKLLPCLESEIAAAIQQARDEIGATEQQRVAFANAEAAMRSVFTRTPIESPPCPELVERVARAIYGSGMTCEPWERLCGSSQTRYRRYARAALEAMRNDLQDSRDAR